MALVGIIAPLKSDARAARIGLGAQRPRAPRYHDLPAVGAARLGTFEDFDERRLAAAVFPGDADLLSAPTSHGDAAPLDLGKLLTQELRQIGLRDAEQDEHGIVLATIPATVGHAAPVIAAT